MTTVQAVKPVYTHNSLKYYNMKLEKLHIMIMICNSSPSFPSNTTAQMNMCSYVVSKHISVDHNYHQPQAELDFAEASDRDSPGPRRRRGPGLRLSCEPARH